MGVVYGCKRCTKCGYKPKDTSVGIGGGFTTVSSGRFIYCKDCRELMTATLGLLDLIRVCYSNDKQKYFDRLNEIENDFPDTQMRLRAEKLPLQTHCKNCNGTNIEILEYYRPPKGQYKTVRIPAQKRDRRPIAKNFRPRFQWPSPTSYLIDCPLCDGGKISLTEWGNLD